MRIALVHDQLHEFGGAERVLFALKKIYPDAPVYTAFVTRKRLRRFSPESVNWEIHESFASKIPFIHRLYSPLRFLAPLIWESFDFSGYDLVVSSSGWYMCKGIPSRASGQTKPIHICYLHHPPRYLYGYETAVEWQKYWPVKLYAHIVNHFLRMWDYESSQRPDYFIANSRETQSRISKFYRRKSFVIYPPVDIPAEVGRGKKEVRDYYITVSRLQKAKHVEILIKAANKRKFSLKIVGEGKDREYLESISGPTVEFLGRVSDSEFDQLYAGAKAFLFASRDEEFGIAPVEAMGYGVPVVAYASGGLLETIKQGKNGFLFSKLTPESLLDSLKQLNDLSLREYEVMCKAARAHARKYSYERFRREITTYINKMIR